MLQEPSPGPSLPAAQRCHLEPERQPDGRECSHRQAPRRINTALVRNAGLSLPSSADPLPGALRAAGGSTRQDQTDVYHIVQDGSVCLVTGVLGLRLLEAGPWWWCLPFTISHATRTRTWLNAQPATCLLQLGASQMPLDARGSSQEPPEPPSAPLSPCVPSDWCDRRCPVSLTRREPVPWP